LFKASPVFKSDILDLNQPSMSALPRTETPSVMSGLPRTETPGVNFLRPVFHFEREGAKEEVTKTCRKYLDYNERLVRKFLEAAASL
jgi:hypothetical protein